MNYKIKTKMIHDGKVVKVYRGTPDLYDEVDGARTPKEMVENVLRKPFYENGGRNKVVKRAGQGRIVRVKEPIMHLLSETMAREGVSEVRMLRLLGFGRRSQKFKTLKNNDRVWDALKIVRRAFWAMGWDVEVNLIKLAAVDQELVLTDREYWEGNLKKTMGLPKWKRKDMWDWLGKVKKM